MEQAAKIVYKPALIIAEAGVNHNGDIRLAMNLCDAAKKSGADIVKFQTWQTDALILKGTELAEYQKQSAESYTSQYEMAKSLELTFDSFVSIKEHCDRIGIKFLSTPDEEISLNFLTDVLNLDTLKIGSGEVSNMLFLSQVGRKNKDVILSTGMSDITEVGVALNTLLASGAKSVSLLHCTSNYPAPFHEVNLKAMKTLRNKFGVDVGYSDHTMGIEIPIAAAALGAQIIEKHFTLDKQMPGPDHKASIEPDEFAAMVKAIRIVENALGDGVKKIQPSEINIKPVVQKSLVAKIKINKGDFFSEENVTAKRAGRGIAANNWLNIAGTMAKKNYEPNDLIEE